MVAFLGRKKWEGTGYGCIGKSGKVLVTVALEKVRRYCLRLHFWEGKSGKVQVTVAFLGSGFKTEQKIYAD